ncbi:hypothetical protein LAZ67_14003528 [Cordylochernes scorpioides]|uniref:Uncharacterized protein n=1 Tax=Cordylochernes scorpioides TaxID=51811 RepID=A0ABY6L7Q1_9ARAC|nr:hypothetical protein LAZ67_14003528 [Cordylochernes scorpioides]
MYSNSIIDNPVVRVPDALAASEPEMFMDNKRVYPKDPQVLVILVLTITLCGAISLQKRRQKLCGHYLAEAVSLVCPNGVYEPTKRAQPLFPDEVVAFKDCNHSYLQCLLFLVGRKSTILPSVEKSGWLLGRTWGRFAMLTERLPACGTLQQVG